MHHLQFYLILKRSACTQVFNNVKQLLHFWSMIWVKVGHKQHPPLIQLSEPWNSLWSKTDITAFKLFKILNPEISGTSKESPLYLSCLSSVCILLQIVSDVIAAVKCLDMSIVLTFTYKHYMDSFLCIHASVGQ